MSYRQSDLFASVRGSLIRAGVPVTITLIIVNAVLFLVDALGSGVAGKLLWCRLFDRTIFPIWSPFTYALDTPGYIQVVFGCLWLWWMGASLERSWGSQRFGLFALTVTLLTAMSVWLGCALLHDQYLLAGLWIPLTALTVAWATINPRQSVLMYMVLPVPAWALAVFEVGYVYFVFFIEQGAGPVLGLFGLIPSALAFWYVRSGTSSGYAYQGYAKRRGPDLRISRANPPSTLDGSRSSGNPLTWLRDWRERRRLRKLWRDSGFSDRDFRR